MEGRSFVIDAHVELRSDLLRTSKNDVVWLSILQRFSTFKSSVYTSTSGSSVGPYVVEKFFDSCVIISTVLPSEHPSVGQNILVLGSEISPTSF